jgi:hypothetical protein
MPSLRAASPGSPPAASRLQGKAEIEENNVWRLGSNPLQPLGGGASRFHAVVGKSPSNLLRDQVQVVIDQQQVSHGMRGWGHGENRDSLIIMETS